MSNGRRIIEGLKDAVEGRVSVLEEEPNEKWGISEGLPHWSKIAVGPVDTATVEQAIHAFALDLLRRAKCGELVHVKIAARDVNGNRIRYRL